MINEMAGALAVPSLAGSALALILALLRPVTKKIFGYRWHYYIWLAVLVVMLLPVRFHLPEYAESTLPLAGREPQTQTAAPAQAVTAPTAGLATDDNPIAIFNNGEKMEFVNKPFMENGQVYVPLRETMEKAGLNEENSRIVWNGGKLQIAIAKGSDTAGLYGMEIGKTVLALKHIPPEELNTAVFDKELYFSIEAFAPPVLKDSVTYVSVRDMDYMLYKFLEMRFTDGTFYELTYQVYDKNGALLSDNGKAAV